MFRLFLILPLLLQWATPLYVPVTAAPVVGGMAVVSATSCQSAGGGGGSGSFNCTIPATTGGNALLYACVMTNGFSFTGSTPSSTTLMIQSSGSGGSTNLSLYASSNITGGITTVNLTTTTAFGEVDCVVAEVSGLPTSFVVDQTTNVVESGFGTGSATNFTGPVTTTHAADTILGLVSKGGPETFTVGTGYILVGTSNGTTWAVSIEYKNVASTATYNPGYIYGTADFSEIDTTAVER